MVIIMAILFSGATVYINNELKKTDIIVDNGSIVYTGCAVNSFDGKVVDCSGKYIFPGFE